MFKLQRFKLPEKLAHLFSEVFEAPIWEMHHSGDLLLIATRSEERLEVTFSLYHLKDRDFLWKEVLFEETWWIGVSHFYQGLIVFHTYENDQNFEKKSIFGFDIHAKAVLWALDDIQPLQASEKFLQCSKQTGEERIEFWIDCRSGEEIAEDKLRGLINKKEPLSISNRPDSPLHYVEGWSSFDSVAQYLELKLGIKAVGACDYLEWGEAVVVSFFEETENGKKNGLVVFNKTGEISHQDTLATDLKGLAHDTFFIANEALIFVKNRSQLNGFSIGD